MRKAVLYLADRLLWASIVLALVLAVPHGARPFASALSFSTDTPVVGYWRNPQGAVVGTYTTTLGELNDVGREVTDHEVRLRDLETLVRRIAAQQPSGALTSQGRQAARK